MTIEELRELFIIGKDATKDAIEGRFEEIAEALFNNFAIRSGDYYYTFKEIEFYFYNSNHKDIITHPRESKPMQFYVNDFGGIDINFESFIKLGNPECKIKGVDTIIKPKYDLNDAYFGGVLIRQLRKCKTTDGVLKCIELLDGPWKCADLFRKLGEKLPVLMEYPNVNNVVTLHKKTRKNVVVDKEGKAQSIIDLYSCIEANYIKESLGSFNTYADSLYCYYVD